MKKYISVFIAAILLVCSLTACSQGNSATQDNTSAGEDVSGQPELSGQDNSPDGLKSGSIQIVTTIFPEYDWVKEILGENPSGAEVSMLMGNGVDLHSFQPSAADIMKISSCDLFVYVGGESDDWVEDALKEAVNDNMVVINLLDILGENVKEEEIVEGMQDNEQNEDVDEGILTQKNAENGSGEEETPEYDEHVWLSLRNTAVFCDALTKALSSIDGEHKELYEANVRAYKEKLAALDQKYQEMVSQAAVKTLLFGDRFPFRYLTDDYGLDYFAAFVGCSAETEASFETITFLAGKMDELGLSSIMTMEGSDHRIAETIIGSTKAKAQKILTLDSMQSATLEDAENGTTYLSIMEDNLNVLKEALVNI